MEMEGLRIVQFQFNYKIFAILEIYLKSLEELQNLLFSNIYIWMQIAIILL